MLMGVAWSVVASISVTRLGSSGGNSFPRLPMLMRLLMPEVVRR
jgi:hypothetical protein